MSTRSYQQVARADATAQTRRLILEAAIDRFYAGEYDVSLDRIAAAAGVTTRTLLRHFGSKENLVEAAITAGSATVEAERAAKPGDTEAFVRALVDHYETNGDRVLAMLAAEDRYPLVHQVAESGRRQHAAMVERAFAADLEGIGGARDVRAALLVTVTDVYTWALLRRRRGLGRKRTEVAIGGLVDYARGAGTP